MNEQKSYLLAFLTGISFGAFSHVLARIYGTKMPASLFLPILLTITTTGTTIGGYYALKTPRPARLSFIFFIALLCALFLHILTQGYPTHYILPNADFPLLAPHHARFLTMCLLLSVFLSASFFAIPALMFSGLFRDAARPNLLYSIHILGILCGILCAYAGVNRAGGYAALCFATLLLVFFFDRPRLKMLTVALVLCALFVSANKKDIFFLWSIKNHRLLSSKWSPYYKLDFVSFDNEQCLGGVYNNFMLWYVCRDPVRDHLQRRMIFKEIGRDRKNVLIIGGSGGVATQTISNSSDKIKLLRAIEIDPVVVGWMKNLYAKYNGGAFNHPTSDVVAAEGRAFIDTDNTKYDLIFYDGVDNRLFSFPKSLVTIENYLFTQDGYKKVFEKNLTRDGILTIDVGGIEADALYPIISSFPKDVHYTVFWYIVMDYPMLQLPLFFVVASRNKQEIEKIRKLLLTIPSIEHVSIDPQKILPPSTDDKPLIYSGIRTVSLILLFLFLGTLLIVQQKVARTLQKTFPSSSHLFVFFLTGILFALWETFIVSKFSRYYFSPALTGLLLLATLLLGSFAANLIQSKIRNTHSMFLGFLLLSMTALFLSMDKKLPPAALFSLTLLCGISAGSFWAFLTQRMHNKQRLTLFIMNSFGLISGILLFQIFFLLLGYHYTFYIIAFLTLFCARAVFMNKRLDKLE